MSDYIFRGKPISGPKAAALLHAINMVKEYASDPTVDDLSSLQKIVDDFGKRVMDDLQKEKETSDE